LTNVVQHMMNDNMHLRDLSVGTLETVKLMPGYDKAIEFLKKDLINKKENKDGVKQQDTK